MKLTEVFSFANLSKRQIGNKGEELAVRCLRRNGYKILCRNFSVPRVGELDIVAKDGEYLCFVEVRLRSRSDYGTPAETVTPAKQRRIVRAAQCYLRRSSIENTPVRFDVVEVFGLKSKPNLIKDAFWARY